jgi:NAD+ kinase
VTQLDRLGVVVHPVRPLDGVLERVGEWCSAHDVSMGQVRVPGQDRRVAEPVEPGDCDLLLAVGGDGTTLAALHSGAASERPVMGVACGSIGVLTSVPGNAVGSALDQVAEGRWTAVDVPALEASWSGGAAELAINDVAVIRAGPGQVLVSVSVDGVLYGRLAGDGVVVASALGSTAYTMAAGGPVLAPGAEGTAVTALAPHGGSFPPLVAGPHSRVSLSVEVGHWGVRYEIDGRPVEAEGPELEIVPRREYATLVRLAEEEDRLTGLRRRGLVTDSPRAALRDG